MSLITWRLLRAAGDIAWIMMFLAFALPISKMLQQIWGMSEFFSILLAVVIVRLGILIKEYSYGSQQREEVADARNG